MQVTMALSSPLVRSEGMRLGLRKENNSSGWSKNPQMSEEQRLGPLNHRAGEELSGRGAQDAEEQSGGRPRRAGVPVKCCLSF